MSSLARRSYTVRWVLTLSMMLVCMTVMPSIIPQPMFTTNATNMA